MNASTLSGLVDHAVALVTLAEEETLIGSAAIKCPNTSYRDGVFKKAGVAGEADEYPFELGWVRSRIERMGNGRRLVDAAVAAAGTRSLYATTRNDQMKHILEDYGFTTLGQPFSSSMEVGAELHLFVRRGAKGA